MEFRKGPIVRPCTEFHEISILLGFSLWKVHSFIHSFIQYVVIGPLQCAKHCEVSETQT